MLFGKSLTESNIELTPVSENYFENIKFDENNVRVMQITENHYAITDFDIQAVANFH